MKYTGIGTFSVTTPSEREITLTRVFDAPCARVYEAWSKPELLKRWFGPPGWTLAICEVDMKVGGTLRLVWHGPNGEVMGLRGVYREIAPPERIVHTEVFDDPWYPGEAVATTVLAEQGGKTTLALTIRYTSQLVRDAVLNSSMDRGVASAWDRLEELLASTLATRGQETSAEGKTPMAATKNLQVTTPSDLEIAMTRVFHAPREMVFDALTKPGLLKRWLLGPPGWTMVVCEVDLRVGGRYRHVLRQANREDVSWGGTYREIVRPERLVHTEAFDGHPGESLVTTVLAEAHGKTTMTATMLFPSKEIRDAVIKSGMEHGTALSYDRLAELLAATPETTK